MRLLVALSLVALIYGGAGGVVDFGAEPEKSEPKGILDTSTVPPAPSSPVSFAPPVAQSSQQTPAASTRGVGGNSLMNYMLLSQLLGGGGGGPSSRASQMMALRQVMEGETRDGEGTTTTTNPLNLLLAASLSSPPEGSCEGQCGRPMLRQNCGCDYDCREQGDCCADFLEQCQPGHVVSYSMQVHPVVSSTVVPRHAQPAPSFAGPSANFLVVSPAQQQLAFQSAQQQQLAQQQFALQQQVAQQQQLVQQQQLQQQLALQQQQNAQQASPSFWTPPPQPAAVQGAGQVPGLPQFPAFPGFTPPADSPQRPPFPSQQTPFPPSSPSSPFPPSLPPFGQPSGSQPQITQRDLAPAKQEATPANAPAPTPGQQPQPQQPPPQQPQQAAPVEPQPGQSNNPPPTEHEPEGEFAEEHSTESPAAGTSAS